MLVYANTYLYLNIKKEITSQNGRRKNVIQKFAFIPYSVILIAEELLKHTHHPYKLVLTYKLSQDCIELLFNQSGIIIPMCLSFNMLRDMIIIENFSVTH